MVRFLALIFILFVCNSSLSFAQLSFQISNYDLKENGVGNQNWDISGDGDQRIFVANNYGLLILENTNTKLYRHDDETIFRSVAYINDTIFTGSFEDFGYWLEDENQELRYHSLVSLLEYPEMNNDAIWKIIEHEGKIYFHSFGSIYCYDQEKVYRLDTEGSFMFLHKIGEEVYTQKVRGGMYKLTNDEFQLVPNSEFLQDEEVKSFTRLPDNSVLIGTTKGIYSYDGSSFNSWDAERADEVVQNNINTMIRTEDKIIVGTILNGLYVYDLNFKLLKNINTENRLNNNTILSLAIDAYDNLWVGMDKGFAYIAFDTPVHTYRDPTHGIGSVYAAALYQNELYIGTNQGVYWYKRDNNGNFFDKQLIPGSQGQVWFLEEFDGYLYGGLNDGTYVIRDKKLQKVSSVFGGYNLTPYSKNNLDVLLQSTYSDLVVFEKENDTWEQSYTLRGFSTPARFLEFDHIGNIWLGHAVKGMFRLQPNIQFDTIQEAQRVGKAEGLSKSTNRVFKLDNRIMTSFDDSLFEWDAIDEQFVHFTKLDSHFTQRGSVKNILPTGNQKYWVIKNSELSLFEVHFNTTRLLYRMIPEMFDFSLVENYENVITLNENLHLISLDDGFAILNLELIQSSKYPDPSLEFQTVSVSSSNRESIAIRPRTSNPIDISNRNNSIHFVWSTSQVVGNKAFFQYRLEGLEDDWNNWTTDTQASFDRLQPGSYNFQVRSMGIKGLLTETIFFPFVINQPWYLSTGAYVLFFLILASFGFMIRLYISRKQWKKLGKELEQKHKKAQRDREKAEQEVFKLTNEKLQIEIEHKSAQLASNTMAIMRKNNLLSTLRDELIKQKKELGDKLPRRYFNQINNLIEQGIEDEHEWEVFEQLYDQAHGNFFKRLKETYPQLTPSDLRLCAYLRMNLASKEIAPLLNISVRGVEERRYRLRKRLDITTDTNLTELIMTF